MLYKKSLKEFKETMYAKWSHDRDCRHHMDHVFNFIRLVKCHLSIDFEIYYTTNYKHDINYINDILNVKFYI